MPLITLMPPPAFEKSLIPAFQTNFNRIRDAFIRTSNRIYVDAVQMNGGWPKSYVLNHPFKADILVSMGGSFWATGVGMAGLSINLDGSTQNNWAFYFCNEANSHKSTSTALKLSGVAAGNHTWSISHIPSGNTTSDGNDWGYYSWVMQEVS
jgi:hypothetical protein